MGGNYEKGLYNQLMEVMARLDAVEEDLHVEKIEHKNDVDRLNAKIDCLTEENRLLKDDNARLKSIINNDSSNTSPVSYTHLFSDGDIMGAVLDRNGLRPSRYYITDDDYLILSSEVGVLDIDPTKIVVKERLRPGKMLLVDTVKGRVIDDDELKETYAGKQPYGE